MATGKEVRGKVITGVERYTFFEVESDTAEGITYGVSGSAASAKG